MLDLLRGMHVCNNSLSMKLFHQCYTWRMVKMQKKILLYSTYIFKIELGLQDFD